MYSLIQLSAIVSAVIIIANLKRIISTRIWPLPTLESKHLLLFIDCFFFIFESLVSTLLAAHRTEEFHMVVYVKMQSLLTFSVNASVAIRSKRFFHFEFTDVLLILTETCFVCY